MSPRYLKITHVFFILCMLYRHRIAAKENDPRRTFFGTGFLKSGPYGVDPMGEIDFKFRTTSSNGILVIAIDDDDPSRFQAMQLSDGHVVYSYNMGHGHRRLSSSKLYDTGDEVTIQKKATDLRGVVELLADRKPFYPGKRPKFVNAEFVYWGGIENKTTIPVNVTKRFFKGCLSRLRLSTGDIKFESSPAGYIQGCYVKPAHNVTFLEDDSPSTKHGLIFLEAHSEEKDFIALGIINGKVTVKANAGNVPLTLQTVKKYNDDKWHFVSVNKDGTRVDLYVDSEKHTGNIDKMQQLIQTTEDMYLGGVPPLYMDKIRNRDFESVILNSLKGGSIKDLTFCGI
ncbi:Laminin subunit alpha-1 [Desmophyllum pertusum]|uniref:Laminin subunit alpha-1 n=1 Tax=Desmophyllum pertusum TaxID=174260 RepID=A0A9X0A2M2_9CNID|nr:Laminin subunit alpha-1 [Desmophyllum pertusum]